MAALVLPAAGHADEVDLHAVLGGGLGGATGAAVGSALGGRDTAILGGTLGAAAGTWFATRRPERHYRGREVVYVPVEGDRHHHRRYKAKHRHGTDWDDD
jgi:hypothetical protein